MKAQQSFRSPNRGKFAYDIANGKAKAPKGFKVNPKIAKAAKADAKNKKPEKSKKKK